ncbi:MAG: hypothetical protein M0R38_04680 [Bacteroidia bacterium]|nr:hypothetical protein [Bacteroidia bacterium]
MIKKILKITGIIILVFVLFLALAPFLFKGKIIRKLKEITNENVLAKVDFNEDISLSLLRSFPNFSLGIQDIAVIGVNEFEGDTLFYAKKLNTTIDIKSVVGGDKINLKTIDIKNPVINLITNKEGKANWDIIPTDSTEMEDEQETESDFAMEIKSLDISEGKIFYQDQELDFSLLLNNFNHHLEGDFTLDNFLLKTKSEVQELTMTYEGVPFLNKVHSNILADLNMDMNKFKFEFVQNSISLNDLETKLDGWMQINDNDIDFDLTFGALRNDFKNFISLIPAIYAKDFASVKTSGKLEFNGFFKGKMTDELMPGYGINLAIDNGYLKYPDLPAALENVQVKMNVENRTGLDPDFILDLSKLSLTMEKNPFDLTLYMKDMANPHVKGAMKGKIDLAGITRIVPLEDMQISGLLTADMAFKGLISKIESGSYEDIDAQGSLAITNMFYKSNDFPDGVKMDKFSLNFTPKTVKMPECQGQIGTTDFNANGQLSNFFAYALSDGTIQGNLNFISNNFNANQFMTSDESASTTTEDTSSIGSIEIPDNIDFNMNVLIKKLKYDKMDIENLKGDLTVRDSKIFFKDAGMQLIGGTMVMNGTFDGKNPKMPFTDIALSMTNFNIPQAFSYFDMIKQYAPFAEKMTGLFSMSLDMKSNLDEGMNLVYPSLSGSGTIGLSNASLSNLKVMNILADQLKLDKFRTLELKDQKLNFKIDNGKFLVDSIMVPLWQNTKLKLGGYSTFDQGLNYVGFISIPRKDLGVGNSAFESLLNQAKKKGLNLEAEEIMNIALSITGNFTKPIVKLDLRETVEGLGKSLVNQAKDQVKKTVEDKVDNVKKDIQNKVDDAKEEARRKAQAEADKIIANAQEQCDKINAEAKKQADVVRSEAKKAAQKIRDEADSQANDLVKKASNPIQKVAAEKAADKIRKEANEKADKIENEANKKANGIEEAAKSRTDKIMQDARKKADETVNKI